MCHAPHSETSMRLTNLFFGTRLTEVLASIDIVDLPILPLLVVIIITPFAPLEPYIAAAEASFKTSIDSIFDGSKFDNGELSVADISSSGPLAIP